MLYPLTGKMVSPLVARLTGGAGDKRQFAIAALSLDFLTETLDSRITTSGGANGTRVNSSGVIVAATCPRIDYDPVTLACKGLMGEGQSTDLSVWSEALDNAAYNKLRATISANAATAPSGGATADKLVEDSTASNTHFAYVGRTGSSETLTLSVFAKAAERTRINLQWSNFATAATSAVFDLTSGTVITQPTTNADYTSVAASIQDYGNGWYRCILTATKGAANTTNNPVVGLADAAGNTIYNGNGSSGAYFWGFMFEAGSFATSYIPTAGAAVTRTVDSTTMTGTAFASVWNSSAESGVIEFRTGPVTGTRPIVSFDDNTANQQIRLYTSGTDLKLTITDGGVTQADLTLGTVAANTVYKAAFAVAANDFAAVMTGGTVQTDTGGTVPVVDRMRIGSDQAGNAGNNHARRNKLYTRRLPNATLSALVA